MNSYRITYNSLFYGPVLHKCIENGCIENKDSNSGSYLVMFRVLKKGSNKIIYNYIYYPEVFTNSILAHMILKSGFKFSFKEWGDFFTFIDTNLGDDSIDDIKELKDRKDELNEHWLDYRSSPEYTLPEGADCQSILDFIKKLTSINDIDTMIMYIDSMIKKDFEILFLDFFGVRGQEILKRWLVNYHDDLYFIKDCLFAVKDLNSFLNKLREKGCVVDKGPKSMRDQLNSMNSFLSCWDGDFRNSLYKHHLTKINNGKIPSDKKLSRNKFSFHNIHQKMGKIKW